MTKRLDSIAGEQDYNSVLVSANPTARVTAIEITQIESADMLKGTVLVKGDSGYVPVSKALTGNDLVLILAEDVEKGSEKVVARVYESGNFSREKLATDGSYTLTDDDYAFMRQAGIYSESVID